MCGRINQFSNINVLLRQFSAELRDDPDRYRLKHNLPPTLDVPVVRADDSGRYVTLMRWGLLPAWTKDLKTAPMLNNARAETVAEKPSFRSAFKKRRCIIPVTGFYEWQDDTKPKQPFYFHSTENKMLAFAGLWETWRKDELTIDSCTIVTTDANKTMAAVHTRMPVILATNDYDRWLDPKHTDATDLLPMLAPCPDDEITCYRVSTFVNNARNEGPECVEPIDSVDATLF